jgi:hypothetical protein
MKWIDAGTLALLVSACLMWAAGAIFEPTGEIVGDRQSFAGRLVVGLVGLSAIWQGVGVLRKLSAVRRPDDSAGAPHPVATAGQGPADLRPGGPSYGGGAGRRRVRNLDPVLRRGGLRRRVPNA